MKDYISQLPLQITEVTWVAPIRGHVPISSADTLVIHKGGDKSGPSPWTNMVLFKGRMSLFLLPHSSSYNCLLNNLIHGAKTWDEHLSLLTVQVHPIHKLPWIHRRPGQKKPFLPGSLCHAVSALPLSPYVLSSLTQSDLGERPCYIPAEHACNTGKHWH